MRERSLEKCYRSANNSSTFALMVVAVDLRAVFVGCVAAIRVGDEAWMRRNSEMCALSSTSVRLPTSRLRRASNGASSDSEGEEALAVGEDCGGVMEWVDAVGSELVAEIGDKRTSEPGNCAAVRVQSADQQHIRRAEDRADEHGVGRIGHRKCAVLLTRLHRGRGCLAATDPRS